MPVAPALFQPAVVWPSVARTSKASVSPCAASLSGRWATTAYPPVRAATTALAPPVVEPSRPTTYVAPSSSNVTASVASTSSSVTETYAVRWSGAQRSWNPAISSMGCNGSFDHSRDVIAAASRGTVPANTFAVRSRGGRSCPPTAP